LTSIAYFWFCANKAVASVVDITKITIIVALEASIIGRNRRKVRRAVFLTDSIYYKFRVISTVALSASIKSFLTLSAW